MYETGVVDLIQRLAFALAIGLLIGLERGWGARDEQEGERTAGFRTHGLSALLGGVWGALALQFAHQGGGVALGLAFLLFGAVMAAFRYREALHDRTFGATSVVAVMLAFSLGAYAVVGDQVAAAAAAVATTTLLALKPMLHGFVQRLTWPELRSVLSLFVMSFILLPVLPDHPIDRFGAINPYELWLLTVLIAAISFAGYVAVRVVGFRRGLAVAGFAGGLASSTAATAAMSRLAAERPDEADAFAASAIFASAVMAPRVCAVLGVLNPAVALRLAAPLAALGLVYLIAGGVVMWRRAEGRDASDPLTLGNPLDLPKVLKFGALLATVTALARILTRYAGTSGVFALAAVSGAADVDAITLAMARQGVGEIGVDDAAMAVAIAILSNTIAKSAMAWALGGGRIGLRLAIASALALAAGAAALAFAPSFAAI
jgi:uncharacterized membrane protein (DUF4010 family)